MRKLRALWRRYRSDDFDRELDSYLAHEIDRNLDAGMSPREAARAAHRKIGNIFQLKETAREMNPFQWLHGVWQDLRYGARTLLTNPGFTAVAIVSLALGIGANTAIFQLVDSLQLRLLPVPHAEQLARLQIADNGRCCAGNFQSRNSNFTFAQWEQIRDHQQAFSSVSAWGDTEFNLANGGEVQRAAGLWVTGDFFRTLEVEPLFGRLIQPEGDRPGCGSSGAVISYPFWQSHFGGDPSVIGKQLSLNGRPFDVIGVTPAGFFGLEVGYRFDVIVPACAEPLINGENAHTPKRHDWWLAIVGRLKPGWTLARATAQVQAISRTVFENTVPPDYRPDLAKYYVDYKLRALPAGSGVSSLREDYTNSLLLLLGIAGVVLLIACANLANLMLARASAREREMAIRLAIGASRARLIRQLLAESFLLAAAGAVIGALLAQLLSRYLVRFLSTERNQLFFPLALDWRVFAFTAGVAVLTCVLFGLTPALRATRTAPASVMKASGRGLTSDRERFGLRRALVVMQVALSLVLLVGALLFTGSFRKLLTLDAGFRGNGLLIANIDLPQKKFPDNRRAPIFQSLLDDIRSTAGVEQAAITNIVPISGNGWNGIIEIVGKTSHSQMIPWFSRVSEGYFRTMGTPLLAGRDFDQRDTMSSPEVAIVNQEFAAKYLGGENPLGKQFRILAGPGEPEHIYQIVGLVKNAKYNDLRRNFEPVAYVAERQDKEPGEARNFILRANSLSDAIAAVRAAVRKESPESNLQFQSFETQERNSLLRERLLATLSGFFGFLAAVLAAVGLYGVISYMVERRKGEIGIRMALGAAKRDVMNLVGREVVLLLAVGLVAGVILSIAAGRAATSLLYGLRPSEPSILAFAVILMSVVALLATLLPTLRACRMEPMDALREE